MESLGVFIRSHEYDIIKEWEAFAKALPSAENRPSRHLQDHIKEMLHFIADDLETPQTEQERSIKSRGLGPKSGGEGSHAHGEIRFTEGLDIVQLHAEFRALRASVLRLWTKTWVHSRGEWLSPTNVISDLMRFNEAVDQMVSESLTRYMEMQNRLVSKIEERAATPPH